MPGPRCTHALRVLCLLLLLPLAVSPRAGARGTPDLALRDLAGQPRKLSSLRGNMVVLNFWATWCGPCREELPRLDKLSRAYKGKPVALIAVSIDEAKDRPKIPDILKQAGLALDVWEGADTDTMARFGLGDIVPSTLILDEHGNTLVRIEGEAREEDVTAPLDWLLSDRSGPRPAAKVRRL